MLTLESVSPIVTTKDIERARRFYAEKLGLSLEQRTAEGGAVLALPRGGHLTLSPRPDPQPSPHTLATFEVRDIEASVRELEERGVSFEDYPEPTRTVNHIAELGNERAAWFKDPDGHVLCLHQRPS